MYTPINDQATIDKRISKFIESKSPRASWAALKKTFVQWRTTDTQALDPADHEIGYEKIDWSRSSFGHTGYRKLAH